MQRRERVEIAIDGDEPFVHAIVRHHIGPRPFDRKDEKENKADDRDDEEAARVATQIADERERQQQDDRQVHQRPSRIE